MSAYETVLETANQLPVADRLQLIDALWDSLPIDAAPPLSNEWLEEIRRRSADYDSGALQPVPWRQVRTEAFQRLSARNANR